MEGEITRDFTILAGEVGAFGNNRPISACYIARTFMGILQRIFNPWSFLVVALAIIHFIRRRPDTYWLYIILFLGPLGASIYLVVEALPDLGLLRQSFKVFPRRRRIHELEAAVIDNPSAGNYEELADLYMEDGNFSKARACYDKAISSRTDSPDPFYRRGVCEVELGDFTAAVSGPRARGSAGSRLRLSSRQRTAGARLRQYRSAGEGRGAFPASDDHFHAFGDLLQLRILSRVRKDKTAEAREWAQKILAKKPTMPGYLRRRERPWFRKAAAF